MIMASLFSLTKLCAMQSQNSSHRGKYLLDRVTKSLGLLERLTIRTSWDEVPYFTKKVKQSLSKFNLNLTSENNV